MNKSFPWLPVLGLVLGAALLYWWLKNRTPGEASMITTTQIAKPSITTGGGGGFNPMSFIS
jgi:hypothetical protein